jgi:subtilisin family serine protease
MKRSTWFLSVVVVAVLAAQPASAQSRVIVRDSLGASALNLTCSLLGCTVQRGLGDPTGQLFLVTTSSLVNPVVFIAKLLVQPGILDAEVDQPVKTQAASAGPAPSYLTDESPVSFYGATVWDGYANQPAVQIIRSNTVHSVYNATGMGATVAVIDTGVDPNNPILKPVLVAGYDFTRNVGGGSEMADVSQSTVAVLDGAQPAQVNQSTVAVLDQSTVAVLDSSQYAAFGHGTMTSGIVHLVAPQAKIMPLKAFNADGSGYASDVLRAVYYAAKNGAKVLNMSFDFSTSSPELKSAINYANSNGLICVASAGNDGLQETVYPAALSNVIDVASTTNDDTQSSFTNFGAPPVWLAAPGEGVVTTYPWGTYAAGWGTSFSAPFVSGTAALFVGINASCAQSQTASALTYVQPVSIPALAERRLDSYMAVQAWRNSLGME